MPSGKVSKRIRAESDAPAVRIPEQSFVLQTQRHTGPLPLPEILEGYKKTDTSFPERIMKMAEAHNAADVSAKNRLSLANLVVPIAGQIFTMLLGAGGIAACVYLTQAGSSTAAIAAVAASFSPIIINAFRTLRRGGK